MAHLTAGVHTTHTDLTRLLQLSVKRLDVHGSEIQTVLIKSEKVGDAGFHIAILRQS